MKKLWILIGVLFLVSCQPKLEERISETFPDGKPKRIQYYTGEGEGKYLAKEVFMYPEGKKKVEGWYNKDGRRDGKWTYWYQDGKRWSEGYFSNGMDDKMRTTWHENGQLHYKGRYDKGIRVGVWKFYDESGKETKKIDYDNESGE